MDLNIFTSVKLRLGHEYRKNLSNESNNIVSYYVSLTEVFTTTKSNSCNCTFILLEFQITSIYYKSNAFENAGREKYPIKPHTQRTVIQQAVDIMLL